MKPGETTTITIRFTMHEGMAGPHNFAVFVKTNDTIEPEKAVNVKADFVN